MQKKPIDIILPQLKKVKSTSNGWQASCPAHSDTKPSLSVKQDNNKVLLYCHAGCKIEDIVHALGLRMTDLFQKNVCLSNPHPRKQR